MYQHITKQTARMMHETRIKASLLRSIGVALVALVLLVFGSAALHADPSPIQVLYSFNGDLDAPYGNSPPLIPFIDGSDGNIYGALPHGGAYGAGLLFRITLDGSFTAIRSFASGQPGAFPKALTQGADGNLYISSGTQVVQFGLDGSTVVVADIPVTGDGGGITSLVTGSDGAIYGAAYGTGANGAGSIFRIGATGTATTLSSFPQGALSGNPGYLVQGTDGSLYGIATATFGYESVFRLTSDGTLSDLCSLGSNFVSSLIMGQDGNLYGIMKTAVGAHTATELSFG
jgi:uncharacterized repeat protein (TIGR03803 family)